MSTDIWALILRSLHLGSFCVFGGSAITCLVLKLAVDRRLTGKSLAQVLELLLFADKAVTAPGALILLASGVALTRQYALGFGSLWIAASLVLWGLGLTVVHALALPQLRRLIECARNERTEEYRAISRYWQITHLFLVSTIAAALCLMIAKPQW
jgi:hypothetical protein